MKIKFKIWDRKLNKFISWNSLPVHDFDSEEYSYCLFTGLLDENGKEIYKGDIVEFCNGISEVTIVNSGAYRVRSAQWGSDDLSEICGICKIVGNIYENPELLK